MQRISTICLVVALSSTCASQGGELKTGLYSGEAKRPPGQAAGLVVVWVDIQSVDQNGKVTAEVEIGNTGGLVAVTKTLEGRVIDNKLSFEGTIDFISFKHNVPLEVELVNELGSLKGKLSFRVGNAQPQQELWEVDARFLGNVMGKWQGVQGTLEQLDLHGDRTLSVQDSAGKLRRGVYSCGAPRPFDLHFGGRMPAKTIKYKLLGNNESTLVLAYLADRIMVLQEPHTCRHQIFVRVENGQVPTPHDTKSYEKLIVGKWKAVGQPPHELLEFSPEGKMVETGPANPHAPGAEQREYPGVYQIEEGVIEIGFTIPGVVGSIKSTIMVDNEKLVLIDQAKNRLTVYSRVK